MVRLRAASNMLRSRLGAGKSVAQAAVDIEVLEAASTEEVPPLAVVPGALERVTAGVVGHSTAEQGLSLARTLTYDHAAVVRYVLKDCFVHAGGVEYRGGYIGRSRSRRERFEGGTALHRECATYCESAVTRRYFGHWLRDGCSTALLAQGEAEPILDLCSDWPDAAPYARAFGIPAAPLGLSRVNELHVFTDHAQGPSKRARYGLLRDRLRQQCGGDVPTPRPIYLKRGATGVARPVADEDRLCDDLAARGFEIVDLVGNDFQERYRKLAAASVLVTIDGSHVNHGYFAMGRGGGLVTLIPSDRFTMVHRGVSNAMGLRYGCVVVEPKDKGYVVSVDEILRTVELVA